MLVNLVLKLEELGRVRLEVSRRLAVNFRLLPVAEDLADELPKPSFGRQDRKWTQVGSLTLGQRLWCRIFTNLQQTLLDLGSVERAWVLRPPKELRALLGG